MLWVDSASQNMACIELANTLTILGFQVDFCLYQNVVQANYVDELTLVCLCITQVELWVDPAGAMIKGVCACLLSGWG